MSIGSIAGPGHDVATLCTADDGRIGVQRRLLLRERVRNNGVGFTHPHEGADVAEGLGSVDGAEEPLVGGRDVPGKH